jgi:hypothetical protein
MVDDPEKVRYTNALSLLEAFEEVELGSFKVKEIHFSDLADFDRERNYYREVGCWHLS